MHLTRRRKTILILFHAVLGVVALNIPQLFMLYYLGVFFYAIIEITRKETVNVRVGHYYIAYVVGLELLIRLSKAIVIDQFGKYGTIALILVALFKTRGIYNIRPKVFQLFIGLMLVSLIMVDNSTFSRDIDLISFYLSGPICMAFCVFYFHDLRFEFNKDFMNTLFISILPLLSITVFIFIKSGGISIQDLGYGANSAQSGGFGPNQVSVYYGYGILVLLIGLIFRESITGYFIGDGLVLVLFVYRILLTFSRGGFLSAIVAILLAIIYISFRSRTFISNNKTSLFSILVGFVLVGFGWYKTNESTGNKLAERYEGYTGDTKYTDRREFSSGRDKLVEIEWEIFTENWILGVGPGMATTIRAEKFAGHGAIVANHTEFTRMLAEHGMYGVLAMIIMVFYPISKLRKSTNLNNSFIIVMFVMLSLLTLAHNAHRLALPSFVYGLAFVNIVKDRKKSDTVLR